MRPAFAAPDTSLKQYRDLFGAYLGNDPVIKGTPDAISRTQSGVFYIRTDRVSNGVTKLLFGANLMFPGLNDGAQYENTENQIWDYVGNNDGDANDSSGTTSSADDSFILRTYQIDTNGQKTNISYETDIYKIMQTGPNVPLNQMPLLSAPQTGQAKFYKWGYFKNANGAAQRVYLVNQKITIPVSYTTAVPYGATMGADLWYCGGRGAGVGNGDFSRGDDEITGWENNVEFFDGDPELCDGTAYWKIGPSITFTLPASAQAAIQENEAQAAAQAQQIANVGSARSGQEGAGDVLPQCSMSNGTFGSGSFVGCIAYLVYYLVYWPVAWFAGILGKLFDFFLGYSLSDASYRAQFAVRGWQIVRDLSNIFFIIILVYTGLMAVFGGGPNMKKVVPQLILNALLINFSLFGTRVIIDISNVVARVFYKSVEVCDGKCNSDMSNKKEGIAGYTPLSEKIVSAFNPQKIFSTDTLSAASALPDNGTSQQGSVNARVADRSTSEYAGYFIVVSLIAAFILFAIAMMFWKTAFFFVGRVIGLYLCMIFAPFAVLTKGGMPLVSSIGELSWKKWSEDLVNYATLAPIFVFFLYVIYSFLETDFIKVYADKVGNSFFETVVYIAIPMIIVWYMIRQGVKIAEKYAGDAGKLVSGYINKATGFVGGAALGVATGGAAFLGRNAVGRGLRLLGNSGKRTDAAGNTTTRAERWAANSNNSWLSRQWNNTYSKTQTGSWDARNTKLGGLVSSAGGSLGGQMGVKFSDKLSGSIYGLGKDSGKGGVVEVNKKLAKRKQEILEKKVDMSHLSDDEAKNAATKYKSDQIKKYGEAHWEEHIDKVDTLKAPKDAMDAAKTALDAAIKDLDDKTKAGTATTADRLARDRAQKDFDNKKQAFDAAKIGIIDNIKQGKADAIKDKALEFAQKEKEKELAAYKVKDAASFGNMMRAEYVNGLQNASFMKKLIEGIDVTNPVSMIGAAAGVAVSALIPPLTPLVVTAMTAAIAKELGDEIVYAATGSNGKAVKAINKKAKSKAGTGNVLIDMEARLETLKAVVTNAIKKDFDKVTEDEILDYTADLQGEVDELNDKIKSKTGTPDELKQARRHRARKLDELDKLKNIQDKIARQQKDIDDHKQKEKEKEENKKKKDEEKK